jgi:hypothetical protein
LVVTVTSVELGFATVLGVEEEPALLWQAAARRINGIISRERRNFSITMHLLRRIVVRKCGETVIPPR